MAKLNVLTLLAALANCEIEVNDNLKSIFGLSKDKKETQSVSKVSSKDESKSTKGGKAKDKSPKGEKSTKGGKEKSTTSSKKKNTKKDSKKATVAKATKQRLPIDQYVLVYAYLASQIDNSFDDLLELAKAKNNTEQDFKEILKTIKERIAKQSMLGDLNPFKGFKNPTIDECKMVIAKLSQPVKVQA